MAQLLAQRGAAVCVNYAVHADAAEAVVGAIAIAGGRAIAVAADVAEVSMDVEPTDDALIRFVAIPRAANVAN
jgi:NAD(P)-dependent dehydrogenase (short-subunit alcohol dehydrogenase family)